MKRILAALSLVTLALNLTACIHAQPAPTKGYNVNWTWTAPTSGSCTSACNYIVSTLAVASGTVSCPSASGQYVPQQTTATAITGTAWTQPNTTGLLYCAVVSSVFSGATSAASGVSNVVTSPALPIAPGVPSGGSVQQAEVMKPVFTNQNPLPQLASSKNLIAPTGVVGVVARR